MIAPVGFEADPLRQHKPPDRVSTKRGLAQVLIENLGHGGTLNHLGVEVATSDTVHTEIARLTHEGLFTEEEVNTTCYFAAQDKVWVTGPGGERWEVYTVLADSDTFGPTTDEPDRRCCTTNRSPARARR
ncbi:MAG TPA: ArsI/CadI family heavy metal resistance metalloenzyme [Mycobacterium sp.]